MKSKVLVAYFSHPGQNWVNGHIENLTKGNTQVVAGKIMEALEKAGYEADEFRIVPTEHYPEDYEECTRVAKDEKNADARPEIVGKVGKMDDYDVVILGYPNWWSTMPMPVYTFLDQYDFGGKRIIPVCTHEGSGMGTSESDLRRFLKNVDILPGVAIRGSQAASCDAEVARIVSEVAMK